MEVKLGSTYLDTITGFSGVAVSRHEYLNGCVRIGIQPRELREGKPIDVQTFDIEQLAPAKENPVSIAARSTGGPGDVPPPRMIPSDRKLG